MRGNLKATVAAVGAAALIVSLTGCVSPVRRDAEDMLHSEVDQAVNDVAHAAPKVTGVTQLKDHVSFIDQTASIENGSLDPVMTGSYLLEDRPDHTAVIEIIAVGMAHGAGALTYDDALVFRCVRITTKLGVKNPDVHAGRIDCPAYVRKAAHIIPDNPEV